MPLQSSGPCPAFKKFNLLNEFLCKVGRAVLHWMCICQFWTTIGCACFCVTQRLPATIDLKLFEINIWQLNSIDSLTMGCTASRPAVAGSPEAAIASRKGQSTRRTANAGNLKGSLLSAEGSRGAKRLRDAVHSGGLDQARRQQAQFGSDTATSTRSFTIAATGELHVCL